MYALRMERQKSTAPIFHSIMKMFAIPILPISFHLFIPRRENYISVQHQFEFCF
jgi:hypothetical protein